MNELILNADGHLTVVGDAGTVPGIIARKVREATIPAVRDNDGNITTPAVVPDGGTLCVEVTRAELVVHPWRLPFARTNRVVELENVRALKIIALEESAGQALLDGTDLDILRDQRTALEVLDPATWVTALAAMIDTDAMDAYLPVELQ